MVLKAITKKGTEKLTRELAKKGIGTQQAIASSSKKLVKGGKFTPAARAAATKKGRLNKNEKAVLTRLANSMDTDIAGVKKVIKKQIADEAKPKTKPKPKGKTADKPKRTPAENKELRRLIAQQKKDDAPTKTPPEPTRIPLTAGGSSALPSKVKLPEGNISKARRRQLIETGLAKQVRGKKGKSTLVGTGRYAPPANQIAEEMGIGASRGVAPTEQELRAAGGYEIKKTGGKVRGVGAATRGFGKAGYSYKNI